MCRTIKLSLRLIYLSAHYWWYLRFFHSFIFSWFVCLICWKSESQRIDLEQETIVPFVIHSQLVWTIHFIRIQFLLTLYDFQRYGILCALSIVCAIKECTQSIRSVCNHSNSISRTTLSQFLFYSSDFRSRIVSSHDYSELTVLQHNYDCSFMSHWWKIYQQ